MIPANTIDVSNSSAEGARKDLLCVRFRVIYDPCDSPDKRKYVSCFCKKVGFILLILFSSRIFSQRLFKYRNSETDIESRYNMNIRYRIRLFMPTLVKDKGWAFLIAL